MMLEQSDQYKPDVLIVEDEPLALSQLGDLLQPKCRKVYLACDGQKGLDLYEEHHPDIVITDIMMMPAMNGFEMVRRIRLNDPECQVVVITAYNESSFLIEAIDLGINHYVLKPVEIGKLYTTIDRCWDTIVNKRKLKQQEKALVEAAHVWTETFDAMTDGISIHDVDNTFLRVNKSLCTMMNLGPEEMKGRKCYQIFHNTDEVPGFCPVRQSRQSGKEESAEFFEPSSNRWYSIVASPVRNSKGEVVKFVHSTRDTTEKHVMEEQLLQIRKMESIGLLAGGVAHDFNNNLTIIMNYCSMLQMNIQKDNPSLDFYLEQIMFASKRSVLLIKSLLEFSRKQARNPRNCDLNQIVKKMQPLVSSNIGPETRLIWDLCPSPLTVCVDTNQIEQVLLNLVNNAKDAMPCGGTLTIATSTRREVQIPGKPVRTPVDCAVLTITDTGTGMEPEIKQQIFDPFFTTKEVGSGTGLGLANAYGFINQHGGFIDVQSEPGKGSSFTVLIPLGPGATEQPAQEAKKTPMVTGRETILIAEDEEPLRVAIEYSLRRVGYTIIHAGNGEEAVARFSANRDQVGLVLMDIMMPVMNGREAASRIRKMKPDVKILFTSGNDPQVMSGSTLEVGMEVLAKPYEPMGLIAKIHEMLAPV